MYEEAKSNFYQSLCVITQRYVLLIAPSVQHLKWKLSIFRDSGLFNKGGGVDVILRLFKNVTELYYYSLLFSH